MRIVSTQEMIEIESQTKLEFGFNEDLIIENVGVQGASSVDILLKENKLEGEIIFLLGKGNNAADGLAMARHLVNYGHKCRGFVLFNESELKESMQKQLKMAQAYGVKINFIESSHEISSYFDQLSQPIVVDGLFGTGVQLPLSDFIYEVIELTNSSSHFTISVDIASGVEGDTGLVQGNSIRANATLGIGFPKLGHYIATGARNSGELLILNCGFPKEFSFTGDKFLLRPEHMVDLVNERDPFGDKKVFGHSLVIGGSHGLTGAPSLAAQASLKVGSGLVTAATWETQYQEMIPRLIPEIMTGYIPLDVERWGRLIIDLNKYSSVVIGPGLARSTRSRRLVLEVLNNFDGPVILDADAINVLQADDDKKAFTMRNAPTVITPHFGEFAKFANVEYEELKRNPVYYIKKLVEEINCTVVLKGPCTYLGCTDGSVYLNYFPNDGMATGGAGDVLAGILGGLLGQEGSLKDKAPLVHRYEAFNRTVAVGIYIHSLAGRIAAEKVGVRAMSARSLLEILPEAFNDLNADIDKMYEAL